MQIETNRAGAPARAAGRRIVQTAADVSFCAGCASCEVVCSLVRDGVVSPAYNRIFVEKDTRTMFFTVHSCQHCLDHPCYDKCPKKGEAMSIDADGIVYIDAEKCIGCGLCIKGCAMSPPRINIVKSADKALRKAKKCDLCRGREKGPACVEWCPVRCIKVSGEEASGA